MKLRNNSPEREKLSQWETATFTYTREQFLQRYNVTPAPEPAPKQKTRTVTILYRDRNLVLHVFSSFEIIIL